MKKYKRRIRQAGGLIIVLSALLTGVYGQQTQEKVKAMRKARFEPVYEMIRSYGVPFDPAIFLEEDWRERLAPILAQMPEMQMVKYRAEPLRGVIFAHTLYLPERVDLVGDTAIIANNVAFEGKDAVIKGPYKLMFYPIRKEGVLGGPLPDHLRSDSIPKQQLAFGTMPRIRGGKITISLSGNGYSEWLQRIGGEGRLRRIIKDLYSQDEGVREKAEREFDEIRRPSRVSLGTTNRLHMPSDKDPTPGTDAEGIGAIGAHGSPGASAQPPQQSKAPNGVCSSNPESRHGAEGNQGAEGGSASAGGQGGEGPRGGRGGDGDINIPDGSTTNYNLDAHGGTGGEGGPGGDVYTGESGGVGGEGGDGANCNCSQGGAGNGGRGGTGGTGGNGGRGGRGGTGGPGGDGGNIIVSMPKRECWTGSVAHNVSKGASGKGGRGALSRNGGSAGAPGGGGSYTSLPICGMATTLGPGMNGRAGSQPDPGDDGDENLNTSATDGVYSETVRNCECKKP